MKKKHNDLHFNSFTLWFLFSFIFFIIFVVFIIDSVANIMKWKEKKEKAAELSGEELEKKTCFCSHRHHWSRRLCISLLNMSGLNHNRGNQIISFLFHNFLGCSFLLFHSCVFMFLLSLLSFSHVHLKVFFSGLRKD